MFDILAENIIAEIHLTGFTQTEFCRVKNLPITTLFRIKNHENISLTTLEVWAKALDMEPWLLLKPIGSFDDDMA